MRIASGRADEPGRSRRRRAHLRRHGDDQLLRVLGTRPLVGRLFSPADGEQAGATPLVVLSHRSGRRRSTASRVVGQTLQLNGRPFTVIGVTPEDFMNNIKATRAAGPKRLRLRNASRGPGRPQHRARRRAGLFVRALDRATRSTRLRSARRRARAAGPVACRYTPDTDASSRAS